MQLRLILTFYIEDFQVVLPLVIDSSVMCHVLAQPSVTIIIKLQSVPMSPDVLVLVMNHDDDNYTNGAPVRASPFSLSSVLL